MFKLEISNMLSLKIQPNEGTRLLTFLLLLVFSCSSLMLIVEKWIVDIFLLFEVTLDGKFESYFHQNYYRKE